MDFRQRLFQYRSYTPIPFLIVMLRFARPTESSLTGGFLIVLVGELLRLWGVSIAGSETRTTDSVGGTFLITKGPFSYVRNPLYLGNVLIYFGIGTMSNALYPWLAFIAMIYFLFQYTLIVSLEEEHLSTRFGEEYVRYCRSVPRFFPVFKRYLGGNRQQPDLDWRRGLASEKRSIQAIGLLTAVLFLIWRSRT